MKSIIAWFLLIINSMFLLTGCWDRREIEDIAITASLGIDRIVINEKDKIRVSVQVIRPQAIGKKEGGGGGGGINPVWVESAIGETLNEAVRNFSTRSSRRLFLAHTKVIVIGEAAAKHGMHEYVDFLQREKDIRLRTWVVVTRGNALDLLKIKPSLETLPSSELAGMFTNTMPYVSKSYVVDLKDFLDAYGAPGQDPLVTNLQTYDIGPDESINDELTVSNGPSKFVRLKGSAVFKGDHLAGFFNDEETRGVLWVNGKMRRGVLALKMHPGQAKDVSIEVARSTSEVIPVINGNSITMKVKIKSEGDLGEHMETHAIEEDIPFFEKSYKNVIKRQIRHAVEKAQSEEFHADIFGFGAIIHRKKPKEWKRLQKKWGDKYFPTVRVEMEVEAKIRRTGMISNSVEVK